MENNQLSTRGKNLIQWTFPEFTQYQRSKVWYFWAIVITFFLLFYAIFTINFLFAVIIVIAAITLITKYRSEPNNITFKIIEDGIELENRFHPWETIEDFYIIYRPPEIANLYFDFKAVTKPRLTIPLQNQNPLKIKELLAQYIDEDLEKEEEPISEAISRILKL